MGRKFMRVFENGMQGAFCCRESFKFRRKKCLRGGGIES
jgi:hypothetical protein